MSKLKVALMTQRTMKRKRWLPTPNRKSAFSLRIKRLLFRINQLNDCNLNEQTALLSPSAFQWRSSGVSRRTERKISLEYARTIKELRKSTLSVFNRIRQLQKGINIDRQSHFHLVTVSENIVRMPGRKLLVLFTANLLVVVNSQVSDG